MESKLIRKKFLEFFEGKGHQVVPSAPLVMKNDPTLMFTNAGMNQFKDYFLGNKEAQEKRVTDTQKCLRVSGKHNDLEEVGIDTYHHTMFEMLGNWSFGDYFKKEAIAWAWELLTDVYKLPKDRLYVTVFEGDKADGLEFDREAYDIWKTYIEEERIIKASKEDNFWEMGDHGPCGPCSEIHIDLRTEEQIAQKGGKELVNQDHPQVIEIWNLVFIQYNRMVSGELKSLPEKHVDTGMGFERLAMALQGKMSNYDTDVFQPLIQVLEKASSKKYGQTEQTDIAMRVCADHIRAVAFAVADGQLPSNTGAGYVIRRILRRAVRYGYTFLNFREPFMYTLLEVLSEQFTGVFPELVSQKEFIKKVVHEEEASFLKTLEHGLKRLEHIKENLKESKVIDGKTAFELYDTFGFPLDLTSLIARENGLSVDEQGFEQEMQVQKSRSKHAATVEKGDWIVLQDQEEVEFLGYDQLQSTSQIIKYREVTEKKKKQYQIVLDRTPFYAESGGQVGDSGYLEANGQKIQVIDTKKENDLIVHFVTELPKKLDVAFESVVNERKRLLTQNNHSATHLLHAALKQVLGDHVQQKGSLVNDKLLRFDFSHFSKMTEEEIRRVEQLVNEKIRENIILDEQRNVPIEKAKEQGATALFGEKYGEFVRVITFDPNYSVELCGGTHVQATGVIGLFKIVSEGSVAAGVRRIEAVTAIEAEAYVEKQASLLNDLREVLKHPKDIKKALESLVIERQELAKEVESLHQEQVNKLKTYLKTRVTVLHGRNVLIEKVKLPSAEALKKLSFELKSQYSSFFMVLAADIKGKPQISVVISEELTKEAGLNAGKVVRELAKEIKGGGGGQPFFATAGGKDLEGLQKVVEKADDMVNVELAH
ncbi:alanine--tRNA ligase [Xanthovirga aplysinae]|uniref:alanine--tRNA ligase n=1 Tax=Xanthovirga aplysinae TaxID=2529853 RepID=UPI0012BC2DAE|nr:alanine--tRNA ligase [Xanthovirga aplysinae]MTI32024.1 alanine--tRNA ligase [Xanthovirga aplysinae]